MPEGSYFQNLALEAYGIGHSLGAEAGGGRGAVINSNKLASNLLFQYEYPIGVAFACLLDSLRDVCLGYLICFAFRLLWHGTTASRVLCNLPV